MIRLIYLWKDERFLFIYCIVFYKGTEDEYELFNLLEDDVLFEDTWKAMEECVKLGYAKSIGLSNFNSQQIERILKIATIKPVVNQVIHCYINPTSYLEYLRWSVRYSFTTEFLYFIRLNAIHILVRKNYENFVSRKILLLWHIVRFMHLVI